MWIIQYPLGPIGLVKRQLSSERESDGIGRVLKGEVEGIALCRYFIPPVISVALAYDSIVNVGGLLHSEWIGLPKGRGALNVGVYNRDFPLRNF